MKRLLCLLFALAFFAFLSPQKAAAAEVPLYQYWNPTIGDHFYTVDFSTLGYGADGYSLERVVCNVFDT